MNFDEILAPMGAAAFLDGYLGKQPLHLEGGAEKFRDVMNWEVLNRLLEMSSIWASASLVLMLDKEAVPAHAYCTQAVGRDGGTVLRPDAAKVQTYLKQGATLVANDIDHLTPELNGFCRAMEGVLGGKVQANLYLSSKKRQGFKVHFDTHDVFAVHVEGEKVWNVFKGRAVDPIAHNMFKSLSQEHHEQAKGELWKEVRLKPGDLLYLPRGQYHYALADDGGCIHIAFGVTYPIGVDVISMLYERMIAEPLCRANLPRDPKALEQRLAQIGDRAAAVLREPTSVAAIKAHQAGFSYPRALFALPDLLDDRDLVFGVSADGVKLVEQGGRFGLVRANSRQAIEVPAANSAMVKWVLAQPKFVKSEFSDRFSNESQAVQDKLLSDLQGMALLRVID